MAKLSLLPDEQILKQGAANTMKMNLVQYGDAILTNQRFVHYTSAGSSILSMFGLIGGLISLLLKGKIDIEMPLTSITTLAQGKYGLSKNVLVIGTADGQSYTLMTKFDPWLTAFRAALQAYAGATLVQSGEKEWTVQGIGVAR